MPGLGWHPSPDPRDASFPLLLALAAPEHILPRASSRVFSSPTILNQGRTNSCVGHAWAHWRLSAPLKTPGTDPFALYQACCAIDEFPANDQDEAMTYGTSLRAGAKVLQSRGALGTYLWTKREAEIRAFILTGQGPVVVGTWWHDGMATPDAQLTMHATGPRRGGHAYLLGGYLETRAAYVVVNSWGLAWGSRGRAFLPAETLGRLLDEDGEACAGVELALAPVPQLVFPGASGSPNAITGIQPSGSGETTQITRT